MKASAFGQRIAYGTMTFAIGIAGLTYGYERLRFPRPVFTGDTIRTRLTVWANLTESQSRVGLMPESSISSRWMGWSMR